MSGSTLGGIAIAILPAISASSVSGLPVEVQEEECEEETEKLTVGYFWREVTKTVTCNIAYGGPPAVFLTSEEVHDCHPSPVTSVCITMRATIHALPNSSCDLNETDDDARCFEIIHGGDADSLVGGFGWFESDVEGDWNCAWDLGEPGCHHQFPVHGPAIHKKSDGDGCHVADGEITNYAGQDVEAEARACWYWL